MSSTVHTPTSSVEIRRTRVFDVASAEPTSFVASNDEVYDTAFISHATNCVAVATNGEEVRLQAIEDDGSNAIFAHGHSQSVLCVDSPDWDDWMFASGSKDNSVLFWRLRPVKQLVAMEVDGRQEPPQQEALPYAVEKIGSATGHTHSVASIAFSHARTLPFLVSVSTDTTLKLWPLTDLIVKQEKRDEEARDSGFEPLKLSASATFVAHSKDINSVDVSANDKLCVTASMDKTAKLWHIDRKQGMFTIAGTLSGHKRGVWAARFSKNLQLVATCSGDCTIKLFSLSDKQCTRTLEGHQFAVLSLIFIDSSAKLVSADGGGLLKVWNVQKGLCELTMEAHTDKIWSLRELPSSLSERARFATSGADGQWAAWEDATEEARAERQREQAKRVAVQQTLHNLLQQEGRLHDALVLTLDLNQPFQCLTVLGKLCGVDCREADADEAARAEKLASLCKQLTPVQLSTLLDYASQWNTNTRTYATAQLLLNCVLRAIPPARLLALPNIDTVVRAMLPYSLRHYERLSNMRKNTAHLEYTFSCMRLN